MDLLYIIQDAMLKQKEEEVLNLLPRVYDFREFITQTHPSADVVVAIKLLCFHADHIPCMDGTCVLMVDSTRSTEV
ncbi:hypothetical protein GQ600_25511 [Phytophthora cactorum]|nr:hypothetical protein GQ600_25511 [Phytophthora cactorum]